MSKLIEKIENITNMDREFIINCVIAHQEKFPASWQSWDVNKMARKMSAMLLEANRNNEKSPARIVLFYG